MKPVLEGVRAPANLPPVQAGLPAHSARPLSGALPACFAVASTLRSFAFLCPLLGAARSVESPSAAPSCAGQRPPTMLATASPAVPLVCWAGPLACGTPRVAALHDHAPSTILGPDEAQQQGSPLPGNPSTAHRDSKRPPAVRLRCNALRSWPDSSSVHESYLTTRDAHTRTEPGRRPLRRECPWQSLRSRGTRQSGSRSIRRAKAILSKEVME